MRKCTICLLLLAMLVNLTACGGIPADSKATAFKDTKVTETVSDSKETQTAETPAAVPAEEGTIADAADEGDSEFEAIPLVATDEYSMKITGIEPDGLFGYTWNVQLENKTDRTLVFCFDDVSVNGIMCDPFWASSVAGGKKSNGDVTWMNLESNGIETPTIITGKLRIYDDETWDDLYDDTFTVMPYGEDEITQVSRDTQETDISLLQTDEYTVTLTDISSEQGKYDWTLYIENNTESDVMIGFENVSINGVMCDPFWAVSISAGMKSNTTVTWYQDFTAYGISEPTIIEGTLQIYDNDTLEDYYTGDFSVAPEGEDAVQHAVREPQETDQTLVDNEYGTVTYTALTDELNSAVMSLYIENKTDANIMVSIEECSINGYMCDPFWAESVAGGKVSYCDVSWYESSLSEIGITNVEEITDLSFTLHMYNGDTGEEYAEEPATVNP